MSDHIWRKSSYSGDDGSMNCVEVAIDVPAIVGVRDSKDPEGPRLTFQCEAWASFVMGVREDEFGSR